MKVFLFSDRDMKTRIKTVTGTIASPGKHEDVALQHAEMRL